MISLWKHAYLGIFAVRSEEQLRALATEKWFMDEGVLHVEQLAKARTSAAKKWVSTAHAGEYIYIIIYIYT